MNGKKTDGKIQKIRFAVQIAFALLCLWIGIEFHLFVKYLESGGTATFFERPPGAEAFLPISSLMSLKYFFLTGEIHSLHPAGFFIFIAIVVVSIVFGKAFCGWICPFGLLSESIADFGDKIIKRIFGKTLTMPRFLDYPLRSLKYLLLGFFAYVVLISMDEIALRVFLDNDYNLLSDIKMYYFFANISQFAFIVVSVLFILSIFIRNFWCRYLCPYGALLGFIGLFSPNKITRNDESCIDCSLCAKVCPSKIKVDKVKTVVSDECISCLHCIDVCPVKETLEMKNKAAGLVVSKKVTAILIVAIFVLITGIGMISGNWQNNIDKNEYLEKFKLIESVGHPTSVEEVEKLKKRE